MTISSIPSKRVVGLLTSGLVVATGKANSILFFQRVPGGYRLVGKL